MHKQNDPCNCEANQAFYKSTHKSIQNDVT